MNRQPFDQTAGGVAVTAAEGRLVFEAIPQATLQDIRAAGVDEAGNQLTVQTDTEGGSPLRCCLRESAPGEQVLLIAYTPPGTRGAYAERGPVFIHARPCDADGERAMAAIAELLARPDVTLVHLRNVGYGCYNFAVRLR
jgi:hypothetical protein